MDGKLVKESVAFNIITVHIIKIMKLNNQYENEDS